MTVNPLVAAAGTGQMMIDEFGLDTEIPIWAVFVAGAVTMLVVVAAMAALATGVRAAKARRNEIRYLRQKVATQDVADDRTGDQQRSDAGAEEEGAADLQVLGDGVGEHRAFDIASGSEEGDG